MGAPGRSSLGWLAALIVTSGCASRAPDPRQGDIEQGPCRKDADCPSEHRCAQDRAHLSGADGITGDLVTFRCEPSGKHCEQQVQDFDQRVTQSRTRPCDADSDCAAICGPRGGCPDENVVVHADDTRVLEAVANEILAECGEFFVRDAAGGYSEVEARCVSTRCEELRTSVAPFEDGASRGPCHPTASGRGR